MWRKQSRTFVGWEGDQWSSGVVRLEERAIQRGFLWIKWHWKSPVQSLFDQSVHWQRTTYLGKTMDKVSLVKVERLRKLFKRERRPHCFGKTFCFVLSGIILDKLQETGYKQAQMAFLPPNIGTNRRRGHYLCLNEEVPVDKKIPHRLNPSCRHCCNLLEPCNRKSRRVCRPEAWTSILHEDFIKRCTYTFSERATAYLAFWSSICCPEYIFLLGSWSTLPERVPSSLFAFRTLSMKEWLFIWLEKKRCLTRNCESSPLLQRGQPPSRSPEREQSSVVCPASWTTLSRALG